MKIIMKVENLETIFKTCKNYVTKNENIYTDFISLCCCGGACQATAHERYKAVKVTVSCLGDDGTMVIPIIQIPKSAKQAMVTIEDTDTEIIFTFPTGKQVTRKYQKEFYDCDKRFSKEEPTFKILFDPKLFREALEAFSGDGNIEMNFFNKNKPCLIQSKTANKEAIIAPKVQRD